MPISLSSALNQFLYSTFGIVLRAPLPPSPRLTPSHLHSHNLASTQRPQPSHLPSRNALDEEVTRPHHQGCPATPPIRATRQAATELRIGVSSVVAIRSRTWRTSLLPNPVALTRSMSALAWISREMSTSVASEISRRLNWKSSSSITSTSTGTPLGVT
ncbi:MAG: hypothetical protein BYD32DRAFT_152005 [Podila humilis]|nr:MAG: hypothetical protein BYD32DRAFT_152005 [Podila humilis]